MAQAASVVVVITQKEGKEWKSGGEKEKEGEIVSFQGKLDTKKFVGENFQ